METLDEQTLGLTTTDVSYDSTHTCVTFANRGKQRTTVATIEKRASDRFAKNSRLGAVPPIVARIFAHMGLVTAALGQDAGFE